MSKLKLLLHLQARNERAEFDDEKRRIKLTVLAINQGLRYFQACFITSGFFVASILLHAKHIVTSVPRC